MYTRLMWSTRHQGRLIALVLSHVHKVNVEHQAPGSAQFVGGRQTLRNKVEAGYEKQLGGRL